MVDVLKSQGALLIGAFFAIWLSGVAAVQVVLYFKLYPMDPTGLKAMVLIIWCLDLTHSGLVITSIWDYVIMHFGDTEAVLSIPLTLSLTITFTAITTITVHLFFAHRIFLLSQKNYLLTSVIVFLATFRLSSACATSGEMLRTGTFPLFRAEYRWLFSMGLSLSSLVDILVTFSLSMLLISSRSRSLSLNHIIDSLILYTFETGSLTCAGTVVSLICWLTMSDNLIFMALHFVIGKLYANSLLAALNTRHQLRHSHKTSRDHIPRFDLNRSVPRVLFQHTQYTTTQDTETQGGSGMPMQQLQVSVEKSVTFDSG